jgi:predicted GIY-YIG superfamily endonuclease
MIGTRQFPDRGSALRAEHALKKLKPGEKRQWAAASCSEHPRQGQKDQV